MRGAMKSARGRGRPAGRRARPPGYRAQAPGSCTRLFGDECAKVLEGLGPKEAAAADRMGALASRMSRRYPFVFLPDFAEDLMDGMSGSAMRSKYCIESPIDFANLVRYTLKLEGFRSKKHGADNRRRNLAKPGWKKTYELISSQAELLRAPLTSLLSCRILTAALCEAVLEKGSVPLKDLKARVAASHAGMKKRVHFPAGARLSYSAAQLDSLVEHLVAAKRLKKEGGRLRAPPKYSGLQDVMYRILDSRTDGASYQSLMTSTAKALPLLRFLPKIPGFDRCLEEMLESGRVLQTGSLSTNFGYSRQLFTKKNYQRLAAQARKEALRAGRTKFFGRSVDAPVFVSELGSLDPEEQASRLAGLALASSALLSEQPGFDFAADVSQRRAGQDALEELGITSAKLCCKASVGRQVSASLVRKLAREAPAGSQPVVFTCVPVPPAAAEQARASSVLIIEKADLVRWCSQVGTVPCRPGSVARVMYGEGTGRVGTVESVDCLAGTARVNLIPDGSGEYPIRCLKDLLCAPDSEGADGGYAQMLGSLARAAPETFEDGMGLHVLKTHATERDMLKSTKPYLFGPGPQPEAGSRSRRQVYAEFENSICVRMETPKKHELGEVSCTCGHRLDQEHYFTLCRHIVAAANHVARGGSAMMPDRARRIARVKKFADRFREESAANAVSALCDVLDPDSRRALGEYLLSRAGG